MACKKFTIIVLAVLASVKAQDVLEDFDFLEPDEVMIATESKHYAVTDHPPVKIIRPHGITNSHRPQYDIDSYEDSSSESVHKKTTEGYRRFSDSFTTKRLKTFAQTIKRQEAEKTSTAKSNPQTSFVPGFKGNRNKEANKISKDVETNLNRPAASVSTIKNDDLETTTKRIHDFKAAQKQKAKEDMIKDAVIRALERKDHVGKFAQVLPIVRAMSGQQRTALASLVARQVSMPPDRIPLNLAQVRSMFGNSDNATADLMLPILLDMANLIRRAIRPGKEPREVKQPLETKETLKQPQPQLLRRSDTSDTLLDDEPFDTGVQMTTKAPRTANRRRVVVKHRVKPTRTNTNERSGNRRIERNSEILHTDTNDTSQTNKNNDTTDNTVDEDNNNTIVSSTPKISSTSTNTVDAAKIILDNITLDLAADATNQTLAQDLPVAEKLRAYNRFNDRKVSGIRRGTYPPKLSPPPRRTVAESTISPVVRRRPAPARKLPALVADQGNCELFTNTLCLHSEDYPIEAIVQSIRRNKAAAGALLADFKDPGDGALDGITAAQEAKYTAASATRRGDTNNREFQTAGEAGFMCPSTVKYARPQRARATSGQWKYIVNTGEHTQTLRLEKCLKPKESCTYLTDNFKSKCVQVYNYHRLLTWDQQNGLHMDIFKVPTCCSCHIEGYSVAFPPLGNRIHESSNENFPTEDLSSEHGNHAFEQVQSTVNRPTKTPPFLLSKPLESFPPFTDSHNLISGSPFQNAKFTESDDFNHGNIPLSTPMDSYGNTYIHDSYNQASATVRNVKRPANRNPPSSTNNFETSLPSYLEPPTPSATSTFFTNENLKLNKNGHFKRGGNRHNRRPIRKKIGGGPDDLTSSGTTAVGNLEALEDFNGDLEDPEIIKGNVNLSSLKKGTIVPKLPAVTTEKILPTSTENKSEKDNVAINSKRVNYNYHPIIDFFEEGAKDENQSIDREDTQAYITTVESEWKPINNPPSRNIQTSSLVGRGKHK